MIGLCKESIIYNGILIISNIFNIISVSYFKKSFLHIKLSTFLI